MICPLFRNNTKASDRRAFTLVELAIVLVIIGLIVGGVLVGRDLIRAAELSATVSQYNQYNAAMNTFRAKYGGLPGDMNSTTAVQFGLYGISGGNANLTGHGDNNGVLQSGDPTYRQCFSGETSMFFLHLAQSKLIGGGYGWSDADVTLVGAAAPGGSSPNGNLTTTVSTVPQVNQLIPPAKLGNPSSFYPVSDNVRNYFLLTSITELQAMCAVRSANSLTPRDARAIDEKLDDGAPATGTVYALDLSSPTTIIYYLGNPSGITTPAANNCVNGASYYTSNSTYADTVNCSLRLNFQ